MSKRLAVAALAAVALAANAPAAVADEPSYECYVLPSVQEGVTSALFHVTLVGVVAHAGGPVSIRCRITVNGVTRAATAYGSGESAAAVAEDVAFGAADTDVVRFCADYTSVHGSGSYCPDVRAPGEVPPPVVFDTVDAVLAPVWPIVDPPVCAALASLSPGVPPVFINEQGDVYVSGQPQWDCPPFDVDWDGR